MQKLPTSGLQSNKPIFDNIDSSNTYQVALKSAISISSMYDGVITMLFADLI